MVSGDFAVRAFWRYGPGLRLAVVLIFHLLNALLVLARTTVLGHLKIGFRVLNWLSAAKT